MTNAEIILKSSLKLMKEGLLKGSGVYGNIKTDDGTIKRIELPEEIHTFAAWKQMGYAVKKGEKSNIKINIWKYTQKEKAPEELTGNPIEDAPTTNMFMKLAAFFTADQVERITVEA